MNIKRAVGLLALPHPIRILCQYIRGQSSRLPQVARKSSAMTIRIIKHEAVPQMGSFEVRYGDGRPSVYFYWDDIPARRLNCEQMDSSRALEAAKTFVGGEREKR